MSLIEENRYGRNKWLCLGVAEHQPTETQNEVVLHFTELQTWCRGIREEACNDRGGCQKYRLEPVMRLAVVAVVLEEKADERRQKEIGEPLELEILCACQKQDELRKNTASLYIQRQSCSITVSKWQEHEMCFQGVGKGGKGVIGGWAGQKAQRVSGY